MPHIKQTKTHTYHSITCTHKSLVQDITSRITATLQEEGVEVYLPIAPGAIRGLRELVPYPQAQYALTSIEFLGAIPNALEGGYACIAPRIPCIALGGGGRGSST